MAEIPISKEKLKDFFSKVSYLPTEGRFIWVKPTKGRDYTGKPCGNLTKAGYLRTSVGGRATFVHHLVWLLETGEWPDGVIDHIDGDRLNNKIENLRVVSRSENNFNAGKRSNAKTSQYKGVSWYSAESCWQAQIQKGGVKHIFRGFQNEVEAAVKYDELAVKLFGQYAKLNVDEMSKRK